MIKTILLATLSLGVATLPALAQDFGAQPGTANPEFLAIDGDSGAIYYNGHNSGRYCVYRTVEEINPYSGEVEQHRVRSCGRGLYLR